MKGILLLLGFFWIMEYGGTEEQELMLMMISIPFVVILIGIVISFFANRSSSRGR